MIRLPEPENNLSFFLSDHILFQEGDRSQMKASKRIRNGDVHVETTWCWPLDTKFTPTQTTWNNEIVRRIASTDCGHASTFGLHINSYHNVWNLRLPIISFQCMGSNEHVQAPWVVVTRNRNTYLVYINQQNNQIPRLQNTLQAKLWELVEQSISTVSCQIAERLRTNASMD